MDDLACAALEATEFCRAMQKEISITSSDAKELKKSSSSGEEDAIMYVIIAALLHGH